MMHALYLAPRSRRNRAYAALASRMLLEPLEPRTLFSTVPATPAQLVAQANNAFAFDLLAQLATSNSGNIFFSPYSISTALEMVLQGAQGQTAQEIIQTLHLPTADLAQAGIQALYQLFQADPATAGYTLSTANRLWVKDNFPLLESFLTSTQDLFGAQPQSIDFSDPQTAAGTINAWVNGQTHGKIPSLISPSMINEYTRLILTNAIYFKGDWALPFNAALTHDAAFQVSVTQQLAVQMMQEEDRFGYYEQDGPNGFQVLDLPYQGNDLDMLVILPTGGTVDDVEAGLNADLFSQITAGLHGAEVNVFLPKFQLNETYDLVDPLKALGMTTAFGSAADFWGISPSSEQLAISFVVHKSFIQVDETGSEAAGATGIGVTVGSVFVPDPSSPILFNADHPFLFAIRDRATNTILFLGRIDDPGYDPSVARPAPPADSGPPGVVFPSPLPPIGRLPVVILPPETSLPSPAPTEPPASGSPALPTPAAPLEATTATATGLPARQAVVLPGLFGSASLFSNALIADAVPAATLAVAASAGFTADVTTTPAVDMTATISAASSVAAASAASASDASPAPTATDAHAEVLDSPLAVSVAATGLLPDSGDLSL